MYVSHAMIRSEKSRRLKALRGESPEPYSNSYVASSAAYFSKFRLSLPWSEDDHNDIPTPAWEGPA